MARYKNKNRCHVRFNKKIEHPCAIIGEDSKYYDFRGMSHEQYKNRMAKLNVNPNKNDMRDAYVAKKYKTQKKNIFGKKKGWKFDKSDYDKL